MTPELSHQMHVLARACARLREAERRSDRARRRMARKQIEGPIPSALLDAEFHAECDVLNEADAACRLMGILPPPKDEQ